MNHEEIAARLDWLEPVPTEVLARMVTRDDACVWPAVRHGEPESATDRELAAEICATCTRHDECLELEFRTTGADTIGVLGGLSEDDRRAVYAAWRHRREGGQR